MSSQSTADGAHDADHHLRARHRSRQGAGAGAEPRRAGAAAPAAGSAAHRRHDREVVARPPHGRAPGVARRALRHAVPVELRAPAASRTSWRASRASAASRCSARGEYSMRVWLDPDRLASRQLTATDVVRAIREQNVQVAAGVLGAPPAPTDTTLPALDQRAGPPDHGGAVRATSSCARRRRPDHAAQGRRPRRARARELRAPQPARQPARGRDRHLPASGLATRSRRRRRRSRADGKAEAVVSRGPGLPHRLRPDDLRARVDPRGGRDAVRCHPAGGGRGARVPADVARLDHSAGRGAGLARRHVRGDARASASR